MNTEVARSDLLSVKFAPENVAARRHHVFDPHVRPLNEWVERLRDDPRLPAGAGATVPWFDPRGGGVRAPVLFLMQDPSATATQTGFISPDNNDPTAKNTTVACRRAGLRPQERVHWNIFPWWVNVKRSGAPSDPSRAVETYSQALALAGVFFAELLERLTELRVVVLSGDKAHDGYRRLPADDRSLLASRGVTVLSCPSCSPQAWNNTDQHGRRRSELVVETLTEAARIARGHDR